MLSEFCNLEISADKVFVACCSIHTRSLLRRSGITRNFGNSLRFHPMLKAVAMFDEDVQRPGDPDPVHQIKHFEPHFSMGCSISTRPMLALAMAAHPRSEEHTSELQSLMRISYAVFCLKKKNKE